jgi:hypothetical protein
MGFIINNFDKIHSSISKYIKHVKIEKKYRRDRKCKYHKVYYYKISYYDNLIQDEHIYILITKYDYYSIETKLNELPNLEKVTYINQSVCCNINSSCKKIELFNSTLDSIIDNTSITDIHLYDNSKINIWSYTFNNIIIHSANSIENIYEHIPSIKCIIVLDFDYDTETDNYKKKIVSLLKFIKYPVKTSSYNLVQELLKANPNMIISLNIDLIGNVVQHSIFD